MRKDRADTLPGYPWKGKFTTIEEINAYFDQDRLTCLLCGRTYLALHKHLEKTHDMAVDDYRERYGIPWRKGLSARPLKEKQAAIIRKQRQDGTLPHAPSAEHIKYLHECAKNRRDVAKATIDARSKHGLRMHGREERWGKKDFEEYLRRIKEGRTVTEVGRDEDMPCREVFGEYCRANPAFQKRFDKVWDSVPFNVQVRGQKPTRRFKRRVVELRRKGLSWPEIAKLMDVGESTVRNTWHRLKKKGELDRY